MFAFIKKSVYNAIMKKNVLSFFSVLLTICCNAQTELSLKNISIEFPDKYSSKEFQGSSVYVVSKDSVLINYCLIQKQHL